MSILVCDDEVIVCRCPAFNSRLTSAVIWHSAARAQQTVGFIDLNTADSATDGAMLRFIGV